MKPSAKPFPKVGSGAEQNRTEQSRAEQNRAEQNRAEQRRVARPDESKKRKILEVKEKKSNFVVE